MGEGEICVDDTWGYTSHPSSVNVYSTCVEGTKLNPTIKGFDDFGEEVNQLSTRHPLSN